MTTVLRDGKLIDGVAGWYDYEPFHDRAVATAPPGSIMVEIGVFCGKSLIALAQRTKASGKNLQVFGVDNFLGSPEFEGRVFFNDEPWHRTPAGMLARETVANLIEFGLNDDVTLIVSDSVRASRMFRDREIHAAFIDASHEEKDVIADIEAWLPKIAPGGMIGGHDYWTFPEVKAAVDKVLPGAVTHPDRSWWEKAC